MLEPHPRDAVRQQKQRADSVELKATQNARRKARVLCLVAYGTEKAYYPCQCLADGAVSLATHHTLSFSLRGKENAMRYILILLVLFLFNPPPRAR